jgi:surfeit locus 1 family protein
VSLKVGSRIFSPRPFTTLLTIVLLALLITLGRWQLHRAAEKQVLYDSFASGTDATRTVDLGSAAIPRYQHVEARGHYDASRQVLIDNMVNGEQAGYFVITPFALQGGGWVLVNRGWVPLGASRAARPSIPVAGDARRIRGRADHLPAAGIQMGERAVLQPPYPVVAAFPTRDEIATLLHEKVWTQATDAILLDAAEPDGYVRNWTAPGFPPMRHVAYAVQWFGLAIALFVIYLVTNFKRLARETAA